jgi:uncharacterized protein YrrD
LPVTIPSQGRRVGVVEDFYYKLEVNSVFALRIKVGLGNYHLLIPSAIRSIERDAITIPDEMALIEDSHGEQIEVYPLGSTLLSRTVTSEDGRTLGIVGDILLDTTPPVALRIAAFRLKGNGTFSANEVTEYTENGILLLDQAAKRLR